MNCKDVQEILHGYVDGEMDLVRSLGVEEHLKECSNCSRSHGDLQSLHKTISGEALYFSAPKVLQERVLSALGKLGGTVIERKQENRSWIGSWRNWLVPFAATALLLFLALPIVTRYSTQNELANEVVSAHLRSLMVDHKTDVASSDQHTVKPWFDGKLDFAPPVVDLTDRGFPLVGGRLDYLNGRPVAALVYQHRKHFINVFVWPRDRSVNTASTTLRGFNLVGWTSQGMEFWAVSDLNKPELEAFSQLLQ